MIFKNIVAIPGIKKIVIKIKKLDIWFNPFFSPPLYFSEKMKTVTKEFYSDLFSNIGGD